MSLSQLIGNRPFVIAEAGVNHNGSLERAMAMVDAAASAGADAVKFQTFRTRDLVSRRAPKAPYQASATGAGSQLEMLSALELGDEAHRKLKDRAAQRGLLFLSTPFDLPSADFLAREIDVPMIKIGSGDLNNAPLLLRAAQAGKPVILSTGMGTLEEVDQALDVLAYGYADPGGRPGIGAFTQAGRSPVARGILKDRVALLHCTSQYPAPCADANLRAIATLRERFGLATGYSDHTLGLAVALAAAALGARIIEKHFTLDQALAGPDHKASSLPAELAALVRGVHDIHHAMGSGTKAPAASELSTREVARRSLTAARPIRKGEVFSEENLAVKRPGDGISPMRYWDWLGKRAGRDYAEDDRIDE
jgi:N-acetylneuraminate synthase